MADTGQPLTPNEQKQTTDLKKSFWDWCLPVGILWKILIIAGTFCAIILYFIRRGGKDNLNFTFLLQSLNLIALAPVIIIFTLFIIRRSKVTLGIKNDKNEDADKEKRENFVVSIVRLEKQFVKFISFFLVATFFLYGVWLVYPLFLKSDSKQIPENLTKEIKTAAWNIRSGQQAMVHEILYSDLDTSREDPAGGHILSGQFDSINQSLYQINEANDEISGIDTGGASLLRVRLQTDNIITHLKEIKTANKTIGDVLLHIDDSAKRNSKYDTAIRSMYYGNNKLGELTKDVDAGANGRICVHILLAFLSNLGALFLVYGFIVLYAKTYELSDTAGKDFLLVFRNLFATNGKPDERKILVTLRTLYGILIGLTAFQASAEFCFPDISNEVYTMFIMISRLGNALALSILIARFESNTFNSSFGILVILYLYTNVQILFGFFKVPLIDRYDVIIDELTLLIALAGKCFLYLYVLWIIRTDRLKYYFYNRFYPFERQRLEWKQFDWESYKNGTVIEHQPGPMPGSEQFQVNKK